MAVGICMTHSVMMRDMDYSFMFDFDKDDEDEEEDELGKLN